MREIAKPAHREEETPLTIWIPTPLHRKLKVVTAELGITLKEYVTQELTRKLADLSSNRE